MQQQEYFCSDTNPRRGNLVKKNPSRWNIKVFKYFGRILWELTIWYLFMGRMPKFWHPFESTCEIVLLPMQTLPEAQLAGFFQAIFGWQYLVEISVRRPNINQILPYQQEGKISPHRTNRYSTQVQQVLCQHHVNHGVKWLWPLPWPVAR